MPDGRRVAARPDPLALFLTQQPLPRYAPTPVSARPGNSDTESSPRRDYHTESFDIRKLAGGEVTLFGAGSVGSYVACALAPAGLRINVVDAGTVRARHTLGGRTAYNPAHVGLKKVNALKDKIERDFPGTIVIPLPYHTSEIPDSQIKVMLRRSLVAIVAIDDSEQMLRLSDLAYPITELVQPAMHAQGATGHIVITAPFVTPCLRCTLGIESANDIHRLDSEPAAGLDITTVALLASRVVLDIACSKVTGQPITRWDPANNLIFIANSKHEMSPDGPGLHFESSRKRPGCPVCNNTAA
jgi:hypothetical protein